MNSAIAAGGRVPAPVCPGDLVHVVAPSGPFDRTLLHRAIAWLRTRYRVRLPRTIFDRRGYLAGSDVVRAQGLADAMRSGEGSAILCVRGGYGLDRIVARLPWGEFARRPKWIMGFSDVTALHLEATRFNCFSIHGPNVAAMARADSAARRRYIAALESPSQSQTRTIAGVVDGHASGPLVGGNLTVLFAAAAAGRLRLPTSSVLLLEDVTEMPYRIDRMLSTLHEGGHVANVAGVVLGEFTNCRPGRDGVSAMDVLCERLATWRCPVAAGLRVGHGAQNEAWVLGRSVRLRVQGDVASLSAPRIRLAALDG